MKIKILDCTLRDGGYVNHWEFGKKTIKAIIQKLDRAHIDIIECGFLTEKPVTDDFTLFKDVQKIKELLPDHRKNSMYVGMIAIGEKEIHPSKLCDYDGTGIDGIRLTFHQNEIDKAMEWAEIIKQKGYKVFMQPVGSTTYTDLALLHLVEKMNELKPYAFYIVDTLGSMYRNELFHIFYLIDKNLDQNIHVGFHAHNNLQLAFSNAQELSRIHSKRKLILDASVYGMGRGAGNLPTELIAEYINKNIDAKYNVMMLLDVYDEHISIIREEYTWGYEVAYHIAGHNICHPNYASYLINKQTLTMKDIEKIVISIPKEERPVFNKKLIEQLYIRYQDKKIDDTQALSSICEQLSERDILILAPGKSLLSEEQKIADYIEKNQPYTISVNFVDDKFPIDACFVSNHKRIDSIEASLKDMKDVKIIATSNIQIHAADIIYIDYYSCINQDDMVFDNVGLMLLNLLKRCRIGRVTLAGFDGFQTRYNENYYDKNLILKINGQELHEKQRRIRKQMSDIGNSMELLFLTQSAYEEQEDV